MTLRRLTAGEIALAHSVFGDQLALGGVRLWFHRLPTRFAVTFGPVITLPGVLREDFSAEGPDLQAWLIHELTHVWQMQTRPLRAIASWASVVATGGYGPGLPGYRYALPAPWARLNLEQQAAIVEDMVRLASGRPPRHGPANATLADYRDVTPFQAGMIFKENPADRRTAARRRGAWDSRTA
jgi:hypothetical protein